MQDTIVAVATAYGMGSISVIRLSGKKAFSLACTLSRKQSLKPRFAYFTPFYDKDGSFIDEGILLYFKAPHSFTGEDVAEFQIHGGVITSQLLIDELLCLGARLANPGEFSKRACLNSKMSVAKALSIHELINSKSISQARLNQRNLQGDLTSYFARFKSELIKVLAYIEASIDYADELEESTLNELFTICKNCSLTLDKIIRSSEAKKGLIRGFRVAIIGKPNVGKSTLLNALTSSQRAIISSQAGTTRDLIEEELILGSHIIRLIDTAGIRQSSDEIEAKGIEKSLDSLKDADIVIALFDASRPFDAEDEQILSNLDQFGQNKLIIYTLNKLDLPRIFSHDFGKEDVLELDITKNLSCLEMKIKAHLDAQESDDLILSNSRLIACVKDARLALDKAISCQNELEIFAFWVNECLGHLEFFGKKLEHFELLDAMFGSFCLGK